MNKCFFFNFNWTNVHGFSYTDVHTLLRNDNNSKHIIVTDHHSIMGMSLVEYSSSCSPSGFSKNI